MSNWFYAGKNKERLGPVEESELLRLNEAGELKGTGLVWKAGMEKWAPLYHVAGEIFARRLAGPDRNEQEPLRPVEVGVCAFSDKVLPREEMVPYGDVLIAIEHNKVQACYRRGVITVWHAPQLDDLIKGEVAIDSRRIFVPVWCRQVRWSTRCRRRP